MNGLQIKVLITHFVTFLAGGMMGVNLTIGGILMVLSGFMLHQLMKETQ